METDGPSVHLRGDVVPHCHVIRCDRSDYAYSTSVFVGRVGLEIGAVQHESALVIDSAAAVADVLDEIGTGDVHDTGVVRAAPVVCGFVRRFVLSDGARFQGDVVAYGIQVAARRHVTDSCSVVRYVT